MSLEKEMKFRVKNFAEIEEKLLGLGFALQKETVQEDLYFSPPHRKFAGTRKHYLRLRKRGNRPSLFAYHEVLNDLETEETETKIGNTEKFIAILEKLNFVLDCVVKKKRKVYRNDLFEVALDEVDNLGLFVELEYLGEPNTDSSPLFRKLVGKLGLKKKNQISGLGYPDLICKE